MFREPVMKNHELEYCTITLARPHEACSFKKPLRNTVLWFWWVPQNCTFTQVHLFP